MYKFCFILSRLGVDWFCWCGVVGVVLGGNWVVSEVWLWECVLFVCVDFFGVVRKGDGFSFMCILF